MSQDAVNKISDEKKNTISFLMKGKKSIFISTMNVQSPQKKDKIPEVITSAEAIDELLCACKNTDLSKKNSN